MKILFLTRSYDQNLGGMETHTQILVDYLINKGNDVDIVTTELNGSKPLFVSKYAKIIRVGKKPNKYLKQSFSHWRGVRKFLLKNSEKYDAVVNVGMSLSGSYRLPNYIKNKIITILHGTYPSERKTLIARIQTQGLEVVPLLGIPYTYLLEKYQKRVVKRSAKVVAVSEGISESLQKTMHVPREKIVLIRNAVDTKKFKFKNRDFNKPLKIVFLGRLNSEKGIYVLLNSVKKLKIENNSVYKQTEFNIAGDGPELENAKNIAHKQSLDHVHFLGRVTHEKVPTVLSEADIFVMPTLRNEAISLSLLEAMSTGLPCIASNVEGLNEALRDNKNGLLVERGNSQELTKQLVMLIKNKNALKRLSKQARDDVVKNYEIVKQLSKFEDVIQNTAI